MSEVAADSGVDIGQTEPTLSEEGSASQNEMGMGMLEADMGSDPEPTTEQTGGDQQVDQATQESSNTTNNDNLSEFERGRREADRYFQQKNNEFLAERQKFEQERQQYQAQQSTQSQPSANADMAGDAETLRQRAMQTNDATQQRALLEQAAGIEYVNKMVEDRLNNTLEQLGLKNYQQDRQLFQQLAEQQRTARHTELTEQIRAAKDVFGEDTLRDELTLQFISNNKGLLQQKNPETGKNFTLSELVGRWTGRPAQQAEKARQTQRSQRTAAKGQAATRGNTSGVRDTGGGTISKSDAIAEIAATF
jgi:hypothetical protein